MFDWKSSVLTCHDADDNCCICRFLDEKGDSSDMLHVIAMLDSKLAATEEMNRALNEALVNKLPADAK